MIRFLLNEPDAVQGVMVLLPLVCLKIREQRLVETSPGEELVTADMQTVVDDLQRLEYLAPLAVGAGQTAFQNLVDDMSLCGAGRDRVRSVSETGPAVRCEGERREPVRGSKQTHTYRRVIWAISTSLSRLGG